MQTNVRRIGFIVGVALLLLGGALVGATLWGGGTGGGGDHATAATAASAPRAAAVDPEHRPAAATARAVTGRVVVAGRGFAGAEVRLGDRRTRSDAGGGFTFEAVPPGRVVVTATAPDHAAASALVEPADRRAEELVLELQPCGATMFGTIRDALGTAIGGATVHRVAPWEQRPIGPGTRADAAGRYELCVPRGTALLSFAAAGFGSTRLTFVAHARHRLDAALVPEGIVVGTAVDAESGAPLPDVQITLWPQARGAVSAEALQGVSDADGRFQIDGAAPGRYLVAATADEHTLPGYVEVVVEAARVADPLLLALEAASRVEGVVLAGGSPVAGAVVVLLPTELPHDHHASARATVRARAGADGRFTLHGVRAGRYSFALPEHDVVTPAELTVKHALVAGVVVEVTPRGAIAGFVRTAGGAPVAGARVQATAPGVTIATSDADGHYQLRGLRASVVGLHAAAPDGSGQSTERTLTLGAQQRLEGVDIILDRTAVLAGVVVDERGAPLEGAEVNASGPVGTVDLAMAVTTADGRFELASLAGGVEYQLTVRPFRNAWSTLAARDGGTLAPVTVAVGGRLDGLRLAVRAAAGEISGVVVDGNGARVPDVLVRAAPEPSPDMGALTPWPAARTADDGSFRIEVRGAERYSLDARGASTGGTRLTGIPAGARGVELRIVAPGSIRGLLRDVDATTVMVARDSEDPQLARVTDGAFRLDGLAPGRYVVTAEGASGRSASAAVDVRAGALSKLELVGVPPARVRGRALLPDGTPASGVPCITYPQFGSSGVWRWAWQRRRTTTDSTGAFSFDGVPATTLVVSCGVDPYHGHGGSEAVDAPGGGEAEVTVRLHRDERRGE